MIKLPVIFDRYARKKDRSYSLTFVTALEVGKEDREAIDSDWKNEGWDVWGNEVESDIKL